LAPLVLSYLKKLEEVEESITQDANRILEVIDLDELLKDPEGYLLALSDAFLREHLTEIEKGSKEGKTFAAEILKRS
tara:strand:+ start:292 stop:522 length:231 start_codon:yes stop_codon:yes gene_type:complete